MQKLKDAIERRGWTYTEAAKQTGLREQSIRNIAGEGETRPTVPANITALTMVRLMETFYPELDVCDFVPNTKLSAVKNS